jgi:hypothetical protein
MRIHYSCPHPHFYHTYTPRPASRSLYRGGFVDGFILFLRYMCVLFCPVCQAAQYNDTLATSLAQRRCYQPAVLGWLCLIRGISWVRDRKNHRNFETIHVCARLLMWHTCSYYEQHNSLRNISCVYCEYFWYAVVLVKINAYAIY